MPSLFIPRFAKKNLSAVEMGFSEISLELRVDLGDKSRLIAVRVV